MKLSALAMALAVTACMSGCKAKPPEWVTRKPPAPESPIDPSKGFLDVARCRTHSETQMVCDSGPNTEVFLLNGTVWVLSLDIKGKK